MVADIVRSGAGLVTTPLLLAARAIQRSTTGEACVLDLTLERLPDVRARTQFLDRLSRVAEDDRVKAVLLHIEGPPGSWAATEDLRAVLLALRAAGTEVYAALEAPGNAAMFLAAACDRVFLVPTGEVGLLGVGAELTFFGAALEKLGVTPDFEAAGAYKSFGEAYTRTFASAANQEAVSALVTGLQDQLVVGIAEGRGLDVEVVQAALARAPLSPADALELGLVDALAYDDQVRHELRERLGDRVRVVGFEGWSRRDFVVEHLERIGEQGSAVAVVYLDGPIVMEEGGRGTSIRARKVVEALRRLRKADEVGAVVLHINSPGGSALASDLMWREIVLLQKEKPVVASFEDVAASGGFYIAAPCNEILARPGTLTGSIGVFGGKMVVGQGLRQLGVHTQQIGGAPNAYVYSPTRPFDDGQRERFRASLQRFYDGFVERVAEGRSRSVDEVEPHCRGRVWTGTDAYERGLIDHFGGLGAAVARARALADLPPTGRRVEVNTLPRRSVVQWALKKAAPSAAGAGLPDVLGPAFERVAEVIGARLTPALDLVMASPGQVLALLPFDIRIR